MSVFLTECGFPMGDGESEADHVGEIGDQLIAQGLMPRRPYYDAIAYILEHNFDVPRVIELRAALKALSAQNNPEILPNARVVDTPKQPKDPERQSGRLAAETTTNFLLRMVAGDSGGDSIKWYKKAICAQTDPEAFFPEGSSHSDAAKKVCAICEVRPDCLNYALKNNEEFGVWGGMTEKERKKIKRRLP